MTSLNCTKYSRNPKIKITEGGRKLVLDNPDRNKYAISRIDGCVVQDGLRADFLIVEIGCGSIILELKGKGIDHACRQLEASAKHPDVIKILEKPKAFIIVCSRFPRIDSIVIKEKQAFAKKFKAALHIYCSQREIKLADCLFKPRRK